MPSPCACLARRAEPRFTLIPTQELLLRLLLAALLGGLIGLERNIHGRPAGLRTHMMVCLGSALYMVVSILMPTINPHATFPNDPARVAAQVVTGIGFLGAGVIIKDGLRVRGLTTAACLWVTAAVGLAAGAGFYLIACSTMALALAFMIFLPSFERLYKKDLYYALRLTLPLETQVGEILQHLQVPGVTHIDFDMEKNFVEGYARYSFRMSIKETHKAQDFMFQLSEHLERSGLPLLTLKWHSP